MMVFLVFLLDLESEIMNEVQYLYSCMGGSYYIPCKILKKYQSYVRGRPVDDYYEIEYLDPTIQEIELATVPKHRIKFPEYSSYIL